MSCGNTQTTNRSLFLVLCSLFFFFVFYFLLSAHAVRAVTVGPSLLEIEAEPGETLIQEIKLFNETNQPLTLYPVLENVLPKKETGQPLFLGDKDVLGAARWISVSADKIVLKSGELKKVLLNIRIPKLLVRPGGYYAALFWTDQPPKNAGIGAANRVGTIFLFRIKGEVKEELKIISFEKEKDVSVFDLQMENSGNTHLKPAGQIIIFNWRRQPVKTIFINPLGQLILPQSRRQFRILEENPGGWGRFYAQAKINYGAGNQEVVSREVSFWLIPEKLGLKIFEFVALVLLVWVAIKIAKNRRHS